MSRPAWEDYWLTLASHYATRATCPRLHVGALVVRDNRLISAGYNGSLPGERHCDDVGCLMIGNHCVRTIHAERNAILRADRRECAGAALFCTHQPCLECLKEALTVGIRTVVCRELYESAARTAFVNELAGRTFSIRSVGVDAASAYWRFEFAGT